METELDYGKYKELLSNYFILKRKHSNVSHCKGCGKKSINEFRIGDKGEYISKCSDPSKPRSKKCNFLKLIVPPQYLDYNKMKHLLKEEISDIILKIKNKRDYLLHKDNISEEDQSKFNNLKKQLNNKYEDIRKLNERYKAMNNIVKKEEDIKKLEEDKEIYKNESLKKLDEMKAFQRGTERWNQLCAEYIEYIQLSQKASIKINDIKKEYVDDKIILNNPKQIIKTKIKKKKGKKEKTKK